MATQTLEMKQMSRPAQMSLPTALRNALLKRAVRVPFAGTASYWQSPDMYGTGMVCNLGHGDLMFRVDRFLQPGKRIYVQLDCLRYKGAAFDVTAEVLWCRETKEQDCLVAALHLVKDRHDECDDPYFSLPETAVAVE